MAAEARFRAMGSDAHVVIVGDPVLLDVARRRVDDLEQRWSRFLPDSEISRLNRGRGAPLRVSRETIELVRRAVDGWQRTGGRFDPTVLGDLVRAGYDRPFEAVVVKPGVGVSALRRDCGGIRLDVDASTVQLPAHTGFDPGGIGKASRPTSWPASCSRRGPTARASTSAVTCAWRVRATTPASMAAGSLPSTTRAVPRPLSSSP